MPLDESQVSTILHGVATPVLDDPSLSVRGLPAASRDMPGIRRLQRGDLPEVCDLFARAFRGGRKLRYDDLAHCFEQIYLTAPGDRERPASLVDVGSDGRIKGFIGIITMAVRHGDRTLRGGILGNFMAADADRAKSALRLTRATLAEDFDFIFSDTANQTSLRIARAVRFDLLPLQSLEWVKVLKPCGMARFLLGKRMPMLGAALGPLARAGDFLARRFAFPAVDKTGDDPADDRPLTPAEFVARAPAFLDRFRLRPAWGEAELAWLLAQASQKTRNGRLHLRAVSARDGKAAGCYLLYCRPGAVAHALQILPRPGQEHVVLGAVIRHAACQGAVAVRGAAQPFLMEGLIRQTGIVYHHVAAAVVFAQRPDVRAALRSEEACLGGLMGEGWTRLVADEFLPGR